MAGKDSGTHGQTETQSTQNAIEVVAWTIKLRAGLLDHGKDVHQLRILEEWSNMIGYKKGSSSTRFYTAAKTGWENDMATIFARGVL